MENNIMIIRIYLRKISLWKEMLINCKMLIVNFNCIQYAWKSGLEIIQFFKKISLFLKYPPPPHLLT